MPPARRLHRLALLLILAGLAAGCAEPAVLRAPPHAPRMAAPGADPQAGVRRDPPDPGGRR